MQAVIGQQLGSCLPIHKNAAVEQPATENMADELALVAQLGLKNLRDILSAPTEYDDGPLLRAKNAAAQTALNAQLRADENRLQQRSDEDTLERQTVFLPLELMCPKVRASQQLTAGGTKH
jgi:hypothetical protein